MKLLKNNGSLSTVALLCLFAGAASASGSITPRFERDFRGDYDSKGLAIALWSDSGWYGGLSYNEMTYSQIDSHDASVNIGYQFSGGTAVSVDYYKSRDPDILFDMGSATLSFPLGFISSRLSDTRINLSGGKTTYETDTAIKRKLHRRDYTLGLTQAITPSWRLGGSYSWHHYIEDLDKAEALLIKQKIKNAAIVGALLGLYDRQWSLWTDFNLSSRSHFSLSFSDGEKLFFDRTRTYMAGYDYRLTESTEVGLQLTRVNDGDEVSRYVALSFSYYF